jgi:hypothetical protein
MFHLFTLLSLLSIFQVATSAPTPIDAVDTLVERQTAGCPAYTIINTRGTGEPQGPSSGFITMNSRIRAAKSGGSIYNTVYAAGFSQNSQLGTADIINKITSTLRSDPGHCFILEGYSQGAAATVAALPRLTGASFNAVKGVFLIGNPNHKAGLACNVDTNGGKTTANVNGISASFNAGIPANWVSKTLDVCNFVSLLSFLFLSSLNCVCSQADLQGDGVCDTTHGAGINAAHLVYPRDAGTQNQGTTFVTAALNA